VARKNSEHADRAKQFAPFDALKGFREALAEKEHIIVPKIELSDYQKEQLDRKFSYIEPNNIITVVYFHKDEYLKLTGMVSKVDNFEKTMIVVKTKIKFSDVYDIQIDAMPDDYD
jgi:hypothetical protein